MLFVLMCLALAGAIYCASVVDDQGPNLLAPLFALVTASGLFIEFVHSRSNIVESPPILQTIVQVLGAGCALSAAVFWLDFGGPDSESWPPGVQNAVAVTLLASIFVVVSAASTLAIAYSIPNLRPGPSATTEDESDDDPSG